MRKPFLALLPDLFHYSHELVGFVLLMPVNADDVVFHLIEPPRWSSHPIVELIAILIAPTGYGILISHHDLQIAYKLAVR
jgi:hypothetical protein